MKHLVTIPCYGLYNEENLYENVTQEFNYSIYKMKENGIMIKTQQLIYNFKFSIIFFILQF